MMTRGPYPVGFADSTCKDNSKGDTLRSGRSSFCAPSPSSVWI